MLFNLFKICNLSNWKYNDDNLYIYDGYDLKENTNLGVITDYHLCRYYDNVYNMSELVEYRRTNSKYFSYNEYQLQCFSGAEGFITTNGGGGVEYNPLTGYRRALLTNALFVPILRHEV